MSIHSGLLRLFPFFAMLLVSSVAFAQHDGGTVGGGTIGGGTKPPVKTTTKPATKPTGTTSTTTTTTPRRRTTAPAPARKPAPRAPSADTYLAQADQFYEAKNYNEALQAYLSAVQINPSLSTAHYRIGWIYNEQGEFQQAIDSLNRSLTLNPNNSAAYAELGYAYRKMKRWDQALASYRKALQSPVRMTFTARSLKLTATRYLLQTIFSITELVVLWQLMRM